MPSSWKEYSIRGSFSRLPVTVSIRMPTGFVSVPEKDAPSKSARVSVRAPARMATRPKPPPETAEK